MNWRRNRRSGCRPQAGYWRTLGDILRQSLPAIQPVRLGMEARVARYSRGAGLPGIPRRGRDDGQGQPSRSEDEWTSVLMDHCDGTVDQKSWDEWLNVRGVPMIPVVRAYGQPFEPDAK